MTPQQKKDTEMKHAAQKTKAKSYFEEADRDGSGMISAKEFQALLASLGLELDNEGAMRLFEEIDVDGSGVVDEDEFMAWYLQHCLGGALSKGNPGSGSYYFLAD